MKKYLIIIAVSLMAGIAIGYYIAPDSGTDPGLINASTPADYDKLKKWYASKLNMSGKMNDSDTMLGVDAWDDGKSVHGDFPISCVPEVKRHIIQVNYIFQYHENKFFQSYGISYLHNFGRFAIGPGFIGSNQNIGVQGVAQVMF
jgi:hypothetical protein